MLGASGIIEYRNDFLDTNRGITTTNIITESNIDFNDRNLSQFFMTAAYMKNNFKPGLILRIPFDEPNYDWTTGFNVAYTFNQGTIADK